MLVAVYKGNKYKFVSNKRRKGIITRCVQKTDGSFLKENDMYYNPVDEKDLPLRLPEVEEFTPGERKQTCWIIKLNFGLLKEYFQVGI